MKKREREAPSLLFPLFIYCFAFFVRNPYITCQDQTNLRLVRGMIGQVVIKCCV